MGTNYLKKYYLEDTKLAQRARLEFFRALDTGRMVAFVGSMSTQAFGYGSWEQLELTFAQKALDVAGKARNSANPINKIKNFRNRGQRQEWDGLVGMSLIEEVLDGLDPKNVADLRQKGGWPMDHADSLTEVMRNTFAAAFRRPVNKWRTLPVTQPDDEFDRRYNVPRSLWNDLGIRRFATPNYDFELERAAMLADRQNSRADSAFDLLRDLRNAKWQNFSWDLGSGRIRRTFEDGWAIESDLLNRERIDRMIEFAVGTDDVNGHIMHVHGRACTPQSMIVTQRDYDNLYRRDDLNRRPFDFAKRMMMGGNPILFVGLGMKEADLNREMQEFISNNPYQRVAPTFLLWSSRTRDGLTPEAREAKRVDFLSRLGVLTIFDSDLVELLPRPSGRDELPYLHARTHDGDKSKFGQRQEALKKKHLRVPVIDRLAMERAGESAAADTVSIEDFEWTWADAAWKHDLEDLNGCVRALAGTDDRRAVGSAAFRDPTVRERHVGTHWRSMKWLTDVRRDPSKPAVLWEVTDPEGKRVAASQGPWLDNLSRLPMTNLVCIIGSQGCGKGMAARQLAEQGSHIFSSTPGHTLLMNGCFCFDTDSLLDCVSHFLTHHFASLRGSVAAATPPTAPAPAPPGNCRAETFRKMNLAKSTSFSLWRQQRALLILNGAERFFDLSGQPLSAELDDLLASIAPARNGNPAPQVSGDRAPAQWVVFGTERVREYMQQLGATIIDFNDINPQAVAELADREKYQIPSFYLNKVRDAFVPKDAVPAKPIPRNLAMTSKAFEGNATGRISGDGIGIRAAVFGSLFDDESMTALLGRSELVPVARRLLRMLAFFGLPVEKDVLTLLPGLYVDDGAGPRPELVTEALAKLVAKGIVLPCRGFLDDGMPLRHVLHRSLLTELRFRFGIPLSEAKLSTAFNMSLYVAQPIDGDIPDHDIHEELGESVDQLIGAYRHKDHGDGRGSILERLDRKKCGVAPDVLDQHLRGAAEAVGASNWGKLLAAEADFADAAASPQQKDEARRAVAVILDETARLCGAAHVRALRAALALMRGYYSTTGLLTLDSGDRLIREGRDGVLLEHAERLDALIDAYGKSAIAREYMRNELGNAEAFIAAFGAAEPFYADELVWLHNERGVVRLAMGDLYEARKSFDMALRVNREWVERGDRAHNWRRIRLNQITTDIELGDIATAERKCAEVRSLSTKGLREDRLAMALVDGFDGWIEHLRGRSDAALALYRKSCRALSQSKEVRAQAYFERLRANAMGAAAVADEAQRRATLERALDLAESAMQMDLVHRLRIDLADTILFSRTDATREERQRANRYLEEAHAYALHTDVHRVRLEAAMSTSRARLHVSDYEGALRYLMDAMMVATRYGMELRKIALRAKLARIMAARGHPVTAEHLARTCIKMATRLRFQTAIDQASRVISDIPRISAAISKSDNSGRRSF